MNSQTRSVKARGALRGAAWDSDDSADKDGQWERFMGFWLI
jgi:hypothetical protein